MDRKLEAEELSAKIDWEGGVYEALKSGLNSDDIDDEELSSIWAELEESFVDFESLVEKFEIALELKRNEDNEEEEDDFDSEE